jgi:hypothetical protein
MPESFSIKIVISIMKIIMTRHLLIIGLALLACISVNAQDFWKDFDKNGIDVEGLKTGQVMNYDQFVAKFGKPDKYERNELGNENEPCLDEYYWVGDNWFSFTNNGSFCTFALEDSRFAALTLWLPGGIRVGDKLSKLDNFKYGKPIVASWLKPRNGYVEYILFYNYLDDLVFLTVKDGIICCISYSDPL